jgi:hypothetical protein
MMAFARAVALEARTCRRSTEPTHDRDAMRAMQAPSTPASHPTPNFEGKHMQVCVCVKPPGAVSPATRSSNATREWRGGQLMG